MKKLAGDTWWNTPENRGYIEIVLHEHRLEFMVTGVDNDVYRGEARINQGNTFVGTFTSVHGQVRDGKVGGKLNIRDGHFTFDPTTVWQQDSQPLYRWFMDVTEE
jgi:hypothetical protein